MTFRVADQVISTNGSYKRIAETRGRRGPHTVTVVRSGPDTKAMRPIYPPPDIRAGADALLVYLGIMGPQDGVEQVLFVMDELVHRRGRDGVHAVLMGFGDCLEELRARCAELRLDDHVTFTGRVGPKTIAQYLSAADIGLCPDLKTPLNELSTMNKTMEYMAYALPSVSFDLAETRVSAGETALYVPSGNIAAFADAVEGLLDHPQRRVALGKAARERVARELDWQSQARAYVGVYDKVFGVQPDNWRRQRWPIASKPDAYYADADVRFVNLDDDDEFESFIARRETGRASYV
jgi:glycosyltransferase involved in cell wall biosynthesis